MHRVLRRLIGRSAGTVWGREHRYDALFRSPDLVAAYQRQVPLLDHAALAPYITRTRDGERDVLWPGRTTTFAVSGGTESGGRVVPLSREAVRSLVRASLAPGLAYLARCRRPIDLLGGKILSVPGGIKRNEFGPGTLSGEVSGLMAYHAPALASAWFQALPRATMLLDDWTRKLSEAARIAVRRDVRAIVMVPSWAPALLDRVRDETAVATTRGAVASAWPNLRVFFSGGVALSGYRDILRSRLGDGVALLESYSASEGFFAFQDLDETPDLLLHLGSGVFFEFVPLEDRGRSAPARHTVGSVTTGVDYTLHVSNASGLFSCAVDDVVRFTSTDPLRLRVVGRAREVLDRFGEAMSREHVERALAEANAACGARSLHVHVSYASPPAGSDVPRHHWLLEFDIPPGDLDLYARRLDDAVQRINGRYRKRREPGAMAAPRVSLLPPGSTTRYLEASRRRLSAQSKLGTLSEERGIADALLDGARTVDQTGIVEAGHGEPGSRS